ncbi:hypothetical protein BPOR_0430g00080 [Botrytis porri]|uniref:Uncharacterized protein n=1 Tax=Botrytis porri TaxID=87229 RepID=A0A4Z1KNA3_9HELO|nr:hypothetical protein BPOR_0430g00080 [Botrytis porri]
MEIVSECRSANEKLKRKYTSPVTCFVVPQLYIGYNIPKEITLEDLTGTILFQRWLPGGHSLETSILRRFIYDPETRNSRSASSRILTLIARLGVVEVIQYYSKWHRRDPQGGSHKDEHVHGSNLGSTAEKPLEKSGLILTTPIGNFSLS